MDYCQHLVPVCGKEWPAVADGRIKALMKHLRKIDDDYYLPEDYMMFLKQCDGAAPKPEWNWEKAFGGNGGLLALYGVDHNVTQKRDVYMDVESVVEFYSGDDEIYPEWMFPLGYDEVGHWGISMRAADRGSIYYILRDDVGRLTDADYVVRYRSFIEFFNEFQLGYR